MEEPGVLLNLWVDPERRQLEHDVVVIEAVLVDMEVAVRTLRVELDNFAHVHHHRLGPSYARLDELDALIAEAIAARTGDPQDILRACEARSLVDPMALDPDSLLDRSRMHGPGRHRARSEGAESGGPPTGEDEVVLRPRVRPSRDAQRLYRDLARRAHPDLTQNAEEKERRSSFIARVNAAYGAGDLAALERLGAEWEAGPDAVPDAGAMDRDEWLRVRLTWLRSRVAELEAERARLEASAIGQLLGIASEDPDTLLDSLAEQLAQQVEEREATLRQLVDA